MSLLMERGLFESDGRKKLKKRKRKRATLLSFLSSLRPFFRAEIDTRPREIPLPRLLLAAQPSRLTASQGAVSAAPACPDRLPGVFP